MKSPTQSLDYRANSYQIHLNTLEFHRYDKEISQKCPCSLYPINTSFLGTLSLPCHPSYFKPISLAEALSKSSRTSAKSPPTVFKFSIFFFSEKKWPSTSSSVRLIYSHLSFLYRTSLPFASLLT